MLCSVDSGVAIRTDTTQTGCRIDPLPPLLAATSPNALGEVGWGFLNKAIARVHRFPHSPDSGPC